MEDYPEELRTPPIPLTALVGCPNLHASISSLLNSQNPPINTLALPELDNISIIERRVREEGGEGRGGGILKREWLVKHRTRVPVAVGVLIEGERVGGGPTQWGEICGVIDRIKAVIRPRNIKLVVIIVQSPSTGDINEDRMLALRKHAEIDSKYVVNIFPYEDADFKHSLQRLAILFAELINVYYRGEGRHVKTRIEKKSFISVESCIRYCFKVAVYAEFRRDWVEALKFYEDAYHIVREMIGTSTRLPAIQRVVEIKTVAEQLHFKISTLLLHGGKITEAVLWFRQHCTSYRKLLGAPEVTFFHWEWMSRQFLVFAELLELSSRTVPGFHSLITGVVEKGLTEWEFQPAYYYQLASHYLKEKRASLELVLSTWKGSDEDDVIVESVVPSTYIGQFARLPEQNKNAVATQPISDGEFTHFIILEGKRFPDSYEIIALLKKSFDVYSSLKAARMSSHCGFQMAKEYFSTGTIETAKQIFESVVHSYRQEGWVALLWEVLGYLRECARLSGSLKEFLEYSLEMAALPVSSDLDNQSYRDCGPAGPPSVQRREGIQKEVFSVASGESALLPNETDSNPTISATSPLDLEIDLVSPLRIVLLASVAFHEQAVKPGVSTLVTISLISQLPLAMEIDALEVHFNQSECDFTIQNPEKSPSPATSDDKPQTRLETAPALVLNTSRWSRLTYDVKSRQSGKLECVSIIARFGPRFAICCRAESPASIGDIPLWKFEERIEYLPTKDPRLALAGQKAIQVEEPDPLVDVSLDAYGPALVGETFVVPVAITSKGHAVYSGELKFNLVDTRGGGLVSPMEIEPHSSDSHHVELVGISAAENKDESEVVSDDIKKIQLSFGLISVPFLNEGESWSCRLEIKWHRPKPIMLYVSLGYSPQEDDANVPKVHVLKSLQIEGKNPVIVSHQLMLPFRCDPLLLSRIKPAAESDKPASLPLNEASALIVSARNCTEVPIRVISMSIESDEDALGSSCDVRPAKGDHVDSVPSTLLSSNEAYKKVFSITPKGTSKARMGTVSLKWRRDSGTLDHINGIADGVVTKHILPDVDVEVSPLIVCLECPPYAVSGDPFTFFVKIRNQTNLLQESKFSLVDSPSFVSCGPHNDTIFVLPKSEYILSYKLVPLASGFLQLPRVAVTSVRYSASFQPSVSASTIFIFPSKPALEMEKAESGGEPFLLRPSRCCK
ncbi:hypothetical protein Drorol1_Dr00022027 [Drosera rotundifolia]